MIDNDIIDINYTKKTINWNRPRFLKKIFTPQELKIISESKNSFNSVWQLWSMKESAYKIYIREGNSRLFNPLFFKGNISTKNNSHGHVEYNNRKIHTETVFNSSYIYTQACYKVMPLEFKILPIKCEKRKENTLTLQRSISNSLASYYDLKAFQCKISKEQNGAPFVRLNEKKVPISITHHGNFAAYVFNKNRL